MYSMSQLQGLSHRWASLFGMPNIDAEYTDYESGEYRLLDGARCLICGRPATNVHHVVPRSVRRDFVLGDTMLRSPLIALCGSGTTGCHNDFHGGARYELRWEWFSESDEDRWWDGSLLRDLRPNDDALFELGEYALRDRIGGIEYTIGV